VATTDVALGSKEEINMSVVINTNSAASIAANNLESANDMLRKSLNKLSSGSKIVNASDDAGGVAVAARLQAASRRSVAANSGIANAISFLQNQDSTLKSLSKIATRMNELEKLNQDATASADDKKLYAKEYDSLKATFGAILGRTFNGNKLVDGTSNLSVSVDDATGTYTLGAIDITKTNKIGSAGSPAADKGLEDLKNSSIGDGLAAGAIDVLSAARARNGADQSALGYYAELGQAQITNYDAAVSRIVDVDVASESTQLARWTTLVQAGTAMLAQANGSTVSAISLLKG